MKHGIRRATHGDIERHGIEECITGSNITGQHALVTILIVGEGVLHNLTRCLLEEFHTVGMSGENGSVSWQRQSDSLCQ